ncbi:MAG TPA: TetR/AcrR family transcriptional regulator [Kiritimatiellia bacterium]|nr:TetR/AcrR family transcriptional regulator [Kiritimatiellia bacterium]
MKSRKPTPASSPPAYHHGRLRKALIEATARIAGQEGLDAVSLRRIAKEVGVSQTAPYHHFPNKAALLDAVAEEAFLRLERVMERAERSLPDPDPTQRLLSLGRHYVAFGVRHPHFFRIMFRPELTGGEPPPPESNRMKSFQRLIQAMQDIHRETGEPSPRVMNDVLFAWSTVHGLVALWLDGSLQHHPAYAGRGIKPITETITSRFIQNLQTSHLAPSPKKRTSR